ncbi:MULTISPECIES: lycopene cyclase domain-containing protein [Microbacterium]|uniref:Lycopene cyclase domain-containing protein n=1 Tax=Microbacterium testaceum (strain StLB037) TaxID=979556 RepID=A0A1H0S4Q6_MICTS|nr:MULTISPECIES: lycopene cyclase domain-containing protein [Microbacterium]KQM36725.1 lycopene cyclase [Microbacterium sp. Leaf203]MCY1717637.1 lycopene cyclase domain-containing protein [Microbacterium sp. SL62]SDP36791.1 lycopene cyclase domain-containing protein [Microbacterium testaceum StLB037]
MTYPLIVLPFVVVTLLVTLATLRRPRFRQRMASSALTALVLVGLTLVFDNLMIAVDLFSYPQEHLSGLKLGLAPLEDFAYPLCAAFLVPALFTLFAPLPSKDTA